MKCRVIFLCSYCNTLAFYVLATPAIATMEQRISVEYHQSFLMPCFAFGDPKPTVDWTKAGYVVGSLKFSYSKY